MPAVSLQSIVSMPVISRLKTFLHNRALARYPGTNLNMLPENHFSSIKSVGILFEAMDAKDREVVLGYAELLKKMGMDVSPLGFFNSKIKDITFPFDFIDLNNITFAFLPEGEKISKFIATPFDVLINLDTSSHRPLNYIAAASKALFKIGPAHGNHTHYDLMIEMHEKDLARYIQDIRTTFNKIQG